MVVDGVLAVLFSGTTVARGDITRNDEAIVSASGLNGEV
jgi:hypothetical protein